MWSFRCQTSVTITDVTVMCMHYAHLIPACLYLQGSSDHLGIYSFSCFVLKILLFIFSYSGKSVSHRSTLLNF